MLNLSHIRTPETRFERVYPAEQFATEEDFRVAQPVALTLDIFKDKAQFRLAGDVKTVLEQPCSRCLEPFPTLVDAHFNLRYQPHAESAGAEERELGEDDLTTAFYENEEIDLAQLMREQFYLSLPMKPLCRDECRGLCPVCGTNLNRGECTCARAWEDPRLAVLKTLKKDS